MTQPPTTVGKSERMPDPFLSVRVHRTDVIPALLGACVGYEGGSWRAKELAAHIVEWLPEFALSATEWTAMDAANSVPLLRKAAQTVYQTKKFENRGEFGELFLHAIIRQQFKSLPAVSKIYYKTSANDTVKGFDAVHVVGPPEDLELWLGEAKFYDNITSAIRDSVAELAEHLGDVYLRKEFLLITGKIDPAWPHAQILTKLLQPNVSLDDVFKRVCVPVLLTYDSACVGKHTKVTPEYIAAFRDEIDKHHAAFVAKLGALRNRPELRIHLFLLPLSKKKKLVEELDRKLKAWQSI